MKSSSRHLGFAVAALLSVAGALRAQPPADPAPSVQPSSPANGEPGNAVDLNDPHVDPALLREATKGMEPENLPGPVRNVGLIERLNLPIPLELPFVNSQGENVYLSKYFQNNNKPAIVGMVYYTCPVTCTAVMEKLNECVQKLDLTVGKDFQILMFSIKPTETTEMAAAAKELYVSGYSHGEPAAVRQFWEFHTGPVESSRGLADALGFRYSEWRPGDYTHPVALFVLTPDGKVARYLYGWEYEPRDVKLSLIEAASGRATIAQRIMAYCYMWDGQTGKYTLQIMRVVQIAGVTCVLLLGGLVGALLWAERKHRRRLANPINPPASPVPA